MILKVENLSKDYLAGKNLVSALININIEIEKGDFLGIMGPSGSGKSTLLYLLGGLDKPTDGDIVLDGENISSFSDYSATLVRRRNIGFVFQFFNLLPTLTAEENIMLPLIIDGKNPKKYKERLDLILDKTGLTQRRNHKPDQLSGGEQQRVALARALITEPAIILADEPTGNLDSKTSVSIMGLLKESSVLFNQTIIMVTHDPRAAAYADRLVFLRDGEITEQIKFDDKTDLNERLHDILTTQERLGY
jgi:putative ABC transport system ATP-binding protein